jgi:nitrogen regulatory protein PII-like uncharacterized protein
MMMPNKEKKKDPTNDIKLINEGTKAAIKIHSVVREILRNNLKNARKVLDFDFKKFFIFWVVKRDLYKGKRLIGFERNIIVR